MFVQAAIIDLILFLALLPFGFKHASLTLRLTFLTSFVALFAGIFISQQRLEKKIAVDALRKIPEQQRPGGYVSSDNCRSCHPNQYSSWHDSYHRTMTQIPSQKSVRGNFNDLTLQLDGETFKFDHQGDDYWVEMIDPDWKTDQIAQLDGFKAGRGPAPPQIQNPPRVRLPISMLTGSHHMQTYWVPGKGGNQQYNLPFTYLFEQDRWVPRRTLFIRDPKVQHWQQVWNVGCIDCHSTGGQPKQKPGEAYFETRVGELGISCEACHGPAENHIALNSNPARRYNLHSKNEPDPSIVNPARLDSKKSAQVCGRCHSVSTAPDQKDWLENGSRFRPGADLDEKANITVLTRPRSTELRRGSFWNDGMIRVSGREYNGLLKTPCFEKGEMSCLTCHSMHQSKPANQLATGMESNRACLQCHTKFENNLEQHTRHSANSSGSLCYNCHMPYTTYGLVKALRSHQISNPSVDASVDTGRPNACNLCHLDKTLDWTAQNLTNWWKIPTKELSPENKTTAASVLWTLQGDAGQRALMAWHMGWEPARQTSDSKWLPAHLATLLDDPYPAVRLMAGRSLKRLQGHEDSLYDYLSSAEDQRKAKEKVLATWETQNASANPSLLIQRDGKRDETKINELLQGRNNRVLELFE